jgi:hypothetical protein
MSMKLPDRFAGRQACLQAGKMAGRQEGKRATWQGGRTADKTTHVTPFFSIVSFLYRKALML